MGTITSPFAKLRASLPPLAPDPAPVNTAGLDNGPIPAFPSTPQPKVSLAPFNVKTATPEELAEYPLTSKLRTDISQDLRPWGFKGDPEAGLAPNHPGFLGKLGHALSVITGGPNRREFQEMGLQKSLQDLLSKQAQEGLETAQTGAIPSETALREAQTENLEHPNLTPLPTAAGYEGYNPKTGKAEPIEGEGGKPLMPYMKPGALQHIILQGSDGKPEVGFVDPQRGVTYDSDGRIVPNPVPFEKPTAPQHITVMGPDKQPHVMGADAQGNFTRDLGIAPPNYAMIAPELKTFQTKDESGQNVTKTLSGKTLGVLPDTTTQRNMAEMAATVQPQIESVIGEVQGLANSVGPAVGRWNQLMTNKGGTDFPEFAALDTDLDLLASAIVRTHFGARGGQQYREELRKMFGEAQSPEDLVNRIEHAESWVEGYAASGGAKTPVGHAYQGPNETEQPIVQMNKKTGAYRYSTDGGKSWQNGQPPRR